MDVNTIRYVVVGLVVICCLAVGGVVLASATGHAPPESLGNVATTCAGALVGILVQVGGRAHADAQPADK